MNCFKNPFSVFTLMMACCCWVVFSLSSCGDQGGSSDAATEQTSDDAPTNTEGEEHPEEAKNDAFRSINNMNEE